MTPKLTRLFLLIYLLFCLSASSQQKKPTVGKQPSWITVNEYDYSIRPLEKDAEDGYFDLAYEIQVSLEERSVFYRKSIRILSAAGVQNSSEVSASFDPSYQQLIFHTVKIIRDGVEHSQLNLSRFKTIQQEKELSRNLYDGSLSSVLFLEDVRKDDIVEYSYTIKGFNPIFKGKYADEFYLNFGVPIGNLYYKVIIPSNREIMVKTKPVASAATVKNTSLGTEYEWRLSDIKPLRMEDDVPGWYDPYSTIMVSEYKSWQEVNDWAINLFPIVENPSVILQKKISDIKANNPTIEQQVLAALRFVQDDIRYLGIEMGVRSHRPGHPNATATQRFGDCKDKSYLLCTLLRMLGVQAYPVLINTSLKKQVADRLPSPVEFDHTTVQAQINGQMYWFDPTISFQRGKLNQISFPDYQCGLVVQPGGNKLTVIHKKEPGIVVIKEVFDIPNMTGDAKLSVTTEYSGSFADDIRSSFNSNSNFAMLETFKKYYGAYLEQITGDSLSYFDDEKTGIFTTKEYYSISKLWEITGGVKKGTFSPYVINGIIKSSDESHRNMPFSIIWPAKFKEEIIINLPEEWDAEESFETIDADCFFMTAKFSHPAKDCIRLLYEYESHRDYVLPDEFKNYLLSFEVKEKKLSYELTSGNEISSKVYPAKGKNTSDTSYALVATLMVCGVVALIWWRNKRS
jgi:hypothetical protein